MWYYQDLKVFNDIYLLTKKILEKIRKFPKLFKYTLWDKIQANLYNSISLLIALNPSYDKIPKITQMIYIFELLQVQIRLAKDMKCFSKISDYLEISEDITTILKQLEWWKKSIK